MGLGALGLILRTLRAAPLIATLAATGWAVSNNPLAAPYVERSTQDLALALERRVARVASTEWIETELVAAVAAEDVDRTTMLLDLATDLDRPVDRTPAETLIARHSGMLANATACGACMLDIGQCQTITQIGACAAPFELSPLGDLNALRRAAVAWATGAEIDTIDASLGLVGLAATGALLATGGGSASVKAGAGLLRLARRMGSVTPELARLLRLPVAWDLVPGYLAGTKRLEEVTDARQLARLTVTAQQMDSVRLATSTPEALRLLRLVDGPRDAWRLARVAEAAGPSTTRTLAVLGKSRAFRATVRLSRAAAGTFALLWLTLVQLAVVVGTRVGSAALRKMVPRDPPRAEPVLRPPRN